MLWPSLRVSVSDEISASIAARRDQNYAYVPVLLLRLNPKLNERPVPTGRYLRTHILKTDLP